MSFWDTQPWSGSTRSQCAADQRWRSSASGATPHAVQRLATPTTVQSRRTSAPYARDQTDHGYRSSRTQASCLVAMHTVPDQNERAADRPAEAQPEAPEEHACWPEHFEARTLPEIQEVD